VRGSTRDHDVQAERTPTAGEELLGSSLAAARMREAVGGEPGRVERQRDPVGGEQALAPREPCARQVFGQRHERGNGRHLGGARIAEFAVAERELEVAGVQRRVTARAAEDAPAPGWRELDREPVRLEEH